MELQQDTQSQKDLEKIKTKKQQTKTRMRSAIRGIGPFNPAGKDIKGGKGQYDYTPDQQVQRVLDQHTLI